MKEESRALETEAQERIRQALEQELEQVASTKKKWRRCAATSRPLWRRWITKQLSWKNKPSSCRMPRPMGICPYSSEE